MFRLASIWTGAKPVSASLASSQNANDCKQQTPAFFAARAVVRNGLSVTCEQNGGCRTWLVRWVSGDGLAVPDSRMRRLNFAGCVTRKGHGNLFFRCFLDCA